MEKFKKTKLVNILESLLLVLLILFLACMFVSIFETRFIIGILLVPIATVLISVSSSLSNEEEYVQNLISYIQRKLEVAYTLEDHVKILDEFDGLVIENGTYVIKATPNLRALRFDIISKIDFLNKLNRNK